MNRFDKRLIGVSATTAAVVAVVTVLVYEGHVHATRDTASCTAEGSKPETSNCDPVSCALDAYQSECCAKLEARPDADRTKGLETCWRHLAKFDPAFGKDLSETAAAERKAYLE